MDWNISNKTLSPFITSLIKKSVNLIDKQNVFSNLDGFLLLLFHISFVDIIIPCLWLPGPEYENEQF